MCATREKASVFQRGLGWPPRSRWVRGAAASLLVAGLAAVAALAPIRGPRSPLEGIPIVKVRRAELYATVLAGGRVESAQSTEVRCALEALDIPGQGGGQSVGGTSTILQLVPDGSIVKKGDILCELDASAYNELVRRQKIAVKQAAAEREQAALTLDVAEISLRAYREGEMVQAEQQFKGQIALMQANLTRQTDRLEWARRMLGKGYTSLRQVASEELAERKMTLDLAQQIGAFDSYQRLTAPKELLSLQSQVVGARAVLDFQSVRLNIEEERLAHYQELVDGCTVRAPHGGFVIHANRSGRTPEVYLGAPVRERLRLFYLPDLSRMEIWAILHETVVDQVQPGMAVRGRVEALPGRPLEGRVMSITQFPVFDRESETGNEVKNFVARVELTTQPAGLRPGMSAEVKILTGQQREVLAIPPGAVTVEEDHNVCYVARADRFERRRVALGKATRDLLEVTEGLNEGEGVALDPALVRSGSAHRSILR
jgi:HlyD family secretion protein